MQLFTLAGRIAIDGADDAQRQLDGIDKKGKTAGNRMRNFGAAAAKGLAIAGTAAIAAGTAMFALTNKITQQADAIAKSSIEMGVSTDAYQQMDYWASQNGLSQASLERAVGRLNQRIGLAATGNDKYASAFEAVNVQVVDLNGNTRATEEVMKDTIAALRDIEDPARRSAMASEIFGTKMARELMPALDSTALSLEDATARAEELGIIMSEDSIQAATEFQDTLDDLKRSFGMVGTEIALQAMPYLQRFADWMIDNLPAIRRRVGGLFTALEGLFTADWPTLWKGLDELLFDGGFAKAEIDWATFKWWLGYEVTSFVAAIRKMLDPATWKDAIQVGSALGSTAASAGAEILGTTIQEASRALSSAIQKATSTRTTTPVTRSSGVGTGTDRLVGMASGGNVIRAGMALVGERGPEILDFPAGARVTPLENTGTERVIVEFRGVPTSVSEWTFTEMLENALQTKQVGRVLDLMNKRNYDIRVRPQGV